MRSKSKQSAASVNSWDVEFVNVELTDEDKLALSEAEVEPTDLWSWVEEMLADHYKLSLTYQDEGDVYVATLTGKENQPTNAGLCFAARAPEITRALYVARFKHEVKMRGDWTKHKGGRKRGGIG